MNRSFDRGPQGYRQPPSQRWPDHTGKAVADAVFHVPPDTRVGEVLTAWSNRTSEGYVKRPRKQFFALIFVAIILVGMGGLMGGLALTWLLSDVLSLSFSEWVPFVLSGVLSLGAGWFLSRPRDWCTYVGTEGIAHHHDAILKRTDDVLRFADAATLNIAETNRYTNGAYQGTFFKFTWKDAGGAVLFAAEGTRFIQGMWKDLEIPAWAFLCAAEVQWNRHRWAIIEDSWQEFGCANFGNMVIRSGELEINTERLSPGDVESIAFEQGFMRVRKLGAKKGLFGSKGIISRPVASIPDFPLFLRALRSWGGFQV